MILLFLLPLMISAYLTIQLLFGVKSENWPNTIGELKDIKIRTIKRYSKFPSITGIDYICIVKVKYEYIVNNKQYISKRIRFGKEMAYKTPDELDSDEFMNQIKNNNFKVYYFGKYPQIAVLQPGIQNKMEHIYGIVFILAIPIALYCFYVLISKLMH